MWVAQAASDPMPVLLPLLVCPRSPSLTGGRRQLAVVKVSAISDNLHTMSTRTWANTETAMTCETWDAKKMLLKFMKMLVELLQALGEAAVPKDTVKKTEIAAIMDKEIVIVKTRHFGA